MAECRPLQCVALGTGRALEERKRLRNVLTGAEWAEIM
jgi:hypothetical protein